MVNFIANEIFFHKIIYYIISVIVDVDGRYAKKNVCGRVADEYILDGCGW